MLLFLGRELLASSLIARSTLLPGGGVTYGTYIHVCASVSIEEGRARVRVSRYIILGYIPLRQGFSLNLELGWWLTGLRAPPEVPHNP